jgi:hypothetical protein
VLIDLITKGDQTLMPPLIKLIDKSSNTDKILARERKRTKRGKGR